MLLDVSILLLHFFLFFILSSEREDTAVDTKRDIRGDMAEERRRLRELDEAEKEERRKKREEEARVKELAAAAECMAFNAAAGEKEGSLVETEVPAAAMAGQEEVPSFELPEELKEYRGDPADERAAAAFRQKQSSERRKLEKQRKRWLGDHLRAQREEAREEEARQKLAAEAEVAKQLEREAAQEALARAQEALDEKMEKLALRRGPLSVDRHHRRYYWPLAGNQAAIYVEDSEGMWGVYSSLESFEALTGSLDRRGVRELALLQALEKNAEVIEVAMKKVKTGAGIPAAAATADAAALPAPVEKPVEKERPAPMRQSSREHKQADFFNPCAEEARKKKQAADKSTTGFAAGLLKLGLGISELTSLVESVNTLLAVKSAATEASLEGPWTSQWTAELIAAGEGTLPAKEDVSADELRFSLQSKALELEAIIAAASKEPHDDDDALSDDADEAGAAEGGENEDGESGKGEREGTPSHNGSLQFEVLEAIDDAFSPSKIPKDVHRLWNTANERSVWQADMRQAGTAARLAYCTALLHQQALPLLRTLRRAVQGPTPAAPPKKQARKKKEKEKEDGSKVEAKKAKKEAKKKKADEKIKERPEGSRRCGRHVA